MKSNDILSENEIEETVTLNGEEKTLVTILPDSIKLIYPFENMNFILINTYVKSGGYDCFYSSDDMGEVNAMLTMLSTAVLALQDGATVSLRFEKNIYNVMDIHITGKK